MQRPVAIALALSFALASAAHADPPATPIAVFETVTLDAVGTTVVARRGATVVRLAEGRLDTPPTIDRKARTLAFVTVNDCDIEQPPVKLTFDQVTSRLDNVVAYGVHKQKRYADSKTGFAKALALDPTNRIAALNLASAQQLLGDKDGAVATLAPWLASEPIAMYASIAADPELAPLLTMPAIAGLAAKPAGTAVVTPGKLKGTIAYAAARNLLAVQRDECSWGADGADACAIDIELFDAATGKLVTALPLENFDGTNRSTLARRAQTAQRVLRDLGFSPATTVAGKNTTVAGDDKHKFVFASQKLGVVGADGAVNVVRGDTVLAHADTLDRLFDVTWAPAAHAFVLSSGRAGHEGCEGTNPSATTVVPVTP